MYLRFVLATLLALPFCLPAHADDVLYAFHASEPFPGTSFTYLSHDGFLKFNEVTVPTTATNLFFNNLDYGPLISFDFFDSNHFVLHGKFNFVSASFPEGINLDTFGMQDIADFATLTITDVPTSATPEPSSFLLLSTSLLGLAGVAKRRYA